MHVLQRVLWAEAVEVGRAGISSPAAKQVSVQQQLLKCPTSHCFPPRGSPRSFPQNKHNFLFDRLSWQVLPKPVVAVYSPQRWDSGKHALPLCQIQVSRLCVVLNIIFIKHSLWLLTCSVRVMATSAINSTAVSQEVKEDPQVAMTAALGFT